MRRIIDDLIRDEGFRPKAYKDHLGKLTIGIGFLIDPDEAGAQEMPESVANLWLLEILTQNKKALDVQIPWWKDLDEARQRVILNMSYQLGVKGLLKFKKMLKAMKAGDYYTAAEESKDSKWARQTPARAQRIYLLIKNGQAV